MPVIGGKMKRRKEVRGYLLLAPSALLICVLILIPTIETVYCSFFNYRTQTAALGMKFIGLENYAKVFSDTFFWETFWWTIIFTVVTVALELVIGMLLALLMTKKIPGQGLIRAVVLVPWAMPAIVAGIIWSQIFAYNGFINNLLSALPFVQENYPWLGNESSAKVAVMIADIWKNTPYMSLLLLSGLLTINKEYYEAATIDGAGRWRQFWSITVPLVRPTMMVTILFRIISAMRVYDLIVAMTNGGPGGSTTTVSMYAISTYFTYGNIGYGSALSVMLLLLSVFISLFFVDSLKSRVR